MSKMLPKKKSVTFFFFIAAALLLCGSYFRIFENNELDTLDMRFRLRPSFPTTEKVVIVEIAEDTLEKLGRFPFDRSYHAQIVKALSESGAKAILFDIFFSEPDKNDGKFAEAVKAAGNVYLPYVFEVGDKDWQGVPEANGYAALNIMNLAKAAKGSGHINVIPDPDGKYRRIPPFIKYRGTLSPYLSMRLICDGLGITQKEIKFVPGKFIQCGSQLKVPLDEDSNIMVNYAGEWGKYYRHYSYVDVLRSYIASLSGGRQVLDLNIFRDTICLIGLTATGTIDLHPNPFSSLYPALGVHADLINSIIQKRFITPAPKATNLIVLLILFLLTLWVAFKCKPLKGFLILSGMMALYALACILLFTVWGFWLEMFYPLFAMGVTYLACLLGRYAGELKKRMLLENELQIARQIQQSFLPKSLPVTKGLEVYAVMFTARQVGGDLYDFYEFSPDKLGVMIGDVSGKGIPAALFMTTISGSLKFFALANTQPQEALHSLNLKLIRDSSTNLFVTLFYATFDLKKEIMQYANGGHLPVIYLTKDAPAQFLDVEQGLPLGMIEASYSGSQISIACGDTFVFYTDGVTEAMNPRAGAYGRARLVSLVESNRERSAQDLLSAIATDVRQFEPKDAQHDDITVIVIKVT